MEQGEQKLFIVGVDGSPSSVEALATALGPDVPGHASIRLLRGNPRPALIEASRSADLLIVGRRGRCGFGGLLLGSVSSACISRAYCPVLVVRADGTDH